MQRNELSHTVWFAGAVCIVCSLFVSSAAVLLGPRQERNRQIDRQRQIIQVAGLAKAGETLSTTDIESRFKASIATKVVELKTGDFVESNPEFDPRKSARDPNTSITAPDNNAGIRRVAHKTIIYFAKQADGKTWTILPIEGLGLWSTLYGYLAIDQDLNTIRGITYYEHGETPGLGGEVDNPRWKQRWKGRKIFGDQNEIKIEVIKGAAKAPSEAPYEVDGISGATLTCDGVTNMVRFWMGKDGFGPFFEKQRTTR